jgi:hypothetical protein
MTIENIFQIFLLIVSIGLGAFCVLLARRLRKLNDLESGLGGAIAVMSVEIERLEGAIRHAQVAATSASFDLLRQIERAQDERGRWDLRQQISDTGFVPPPVSPSRRLRKRGGPADA